MRTPRLAAAVLVPLALTAACAGHRKRGAGAPDSATLEVRSNYIGSVDVFAIRDNGFRVRLASNVGSTLQRVRLGPSVIGGGGSLRIIAVPLAERRNVASTGLIVVRPGNVVEFTVSPNLTASSVFIR